MRRKITFIITAIVFLTLIHPVVHAQRAKVQNLQGYDYAPYHFGFILGMNEMLFTIKTLPGFQYDSYSSLQTPDIFADSAKLLGIEHKPAFGFTIGIVSNLKLGEYFDLRFIPSLAFGERDIEYSILSNFDGERNRVFVTKKIQSTFVEFPMHVKFKGSRMNNVRPYWLAGAKYSLDLASDSKKRKEDSNLYISIERNDFYGEIGGGFDFYTTYFKFGVELKMSYGLRDILKREGNIYTDAIDKLNSKLFLLSFTFE